jgi:hypothetical protein
MLVPTSLRDESLQGHPMPPRTTQESYRPRASDRTMVGNAATVTLVSFGSRSGPSRLQDHPRSLKPMAPLRTEKQTGIARPSRGAGCRDTCSQRWTTGEVFVLTSPFIGHSDNRCQPVDTELDIGLTLHVFHSHHNFHSLNDRFPLPPAWGVLR